MHFLTLLVKKQLELIYFTINIYLPLAFLAYYSYFQGPLCEHLLHSELHLIGHTYSENGDYKNLLSFQIINLPFIAAFPSSSIPSNFGTQPGTSSHSLQLLQWAPSTSARKGCGARRASSKVGTFAQNHLESVHKSSTTRSSWEAPEWSSTWANWWCCVIINDWKHTTSFL